MSGHSAATLFIDSNDYTVAKKAALLFQHDVEMVSGIKPGLSSNAPSAKNAIIIGSIGNSRLIDQLIKQKKLVVDSIQNKWEAYQVQIVEHPFPNVEKALVIAGSDRRGTAYGVLTLSEHIGVSPLHFWADVPVKKKAEIYYIGGHIYDAPAVQYRGIFINDEAPALSGWVWEKFGGFNHFFYEKVFELILRMKGNYLWPAMWGNAFNDDNSLNPKLADDYAIVMGTSHHEPLVRAQAEWKRYGAGHWNYELNKENLQSFWRKGIERMGKRENIVSIGMRGDGDMPMTEGTAISLLEKIVKDQRQIIADVTKKPASQTPQLWALYKEVQDYYDKGMRVPDDVTLLLSDDNWGNIRKLPKLQEKPRSGGYGIYYHFDYVGDPRNYKWINTNPIARVWEQMHLAYEHGVDKIWIVNVGDIKPMEFPMQFFLDNAWNPAKYNADNLVMYTEQWAGKQFGEYAKDIADVITTYLQYANRRKPELLSAETFSLINYNEADRITNEYNSLLSKAETINSLLPVQYKDAFYQLVLHPVQALANIQKLYVVVAKNQLYAKQGRSSANTHADSAKQLYIKDSLITKYYNDTLAGGKWHHMADQTHIGYTYWQQPETNAMPAVAYLPARDAAGMGIAVEGDSSLSRNLTLPEFNALYPQPHWIDIFNKGKASFNYTITTDAPYILVSQSNGSVADEQRVNISVNYKKAPLHRSLVPLFITGADTTITVWVRVINTPANQSFYPGFVEVNGTVSMEAEHYSKAISKQPVTWQVIPNLGRTLSGITTFPVTAPGNMPGNNGAHLQYKMFLNDTGLVKIHAYLSPTLPFHNKGLRYAISVDDEKPQLVDMHEGYTEMVWRTWVADAVIDKTSTHYIGKAGEHVLKFWRIDAGVVLQKLIVDAGGLKESYLGPSETYVTGK